MGTTLVSCGPGTPRDGDAASSSSVRLAPCACHIVCPPLRAALLAATRVRVLLLCRLSVCDGTRTARLASGQTAVPSDIESPDRVGSPGCEGRPAQQQSDLSCFGFSDMEPRPTARGPPVMTPKVYAGTDAVSSVILTFRRSPLPVPCEPTSVSLPEATTGAPQARRTIAVRRTLRMRLPP